MTNDKRRQIIAGVKQQLTLLGEKKDELSITIREAIIARITKELTELDNDLA